MSHNSSHTLIKQKRSKASITACAPHEPRRAAQAAAARRHPSFAVQPSPPSIAERDCAAMEAPTSLLDLPEPALCTILDAIDLPER